MADLEQATNRLYRWFALSSLVFVTILAISPVKDYFHEYRPRQIAYRKLLLETAGSAKELSQAQALSVGIRQIWMPDFGNRVDRCVTCHLGVDNPKATGAPEPFRRHPVTPHTPDDLQRFGCVVCHRGQGRATSAAEAHGHGADWDTPLLPEHYTEASCGRCHLSESIPEASLLSAGRALMTRVGCFGCHKVPGHEDWRSEAPDLNGLSQKTSPGWLRAWLKSPRSLRPATWMPDFHLSDTELDALLEFLWSRPPAGPEDTVPQVSLPAGDAERGRTLFGQSRCVSCHTIDGRGNGSAPEFAGIGSKLTRPWLVAFLADPHAYQPRSRMPRYDFTRQDLLDLSQYLMEELVDPSAPSPGGTLRTAQRTVEQGEKVYRKYGCGGCHRIGGRDEAAPVGPDLAGIGDKAVDLLDFGTREDLPRSLPDWLAAKISQPRTFRGDLKMPEFGFAPEQVQEIVTALLSVSSDVIPQSYRVPAVQSTYSPPGRFGRLADGYRCLSCHIVEGAGRDISTAPLTVEGSRVRKDWLTRYLLNPSTIRPILTDRMIPLRMSVQEAAFISDFIENVYVDNQIPEEIFPAGAPRDSVERGRHLFFERHGCQACHTVEGRGGYYGPLLDGAVDRLKSGWVFWWLRGPQRWRPDIRCPDYGLDETDARDLTAFVMSIPAATGSLAVSSSGGQP